MRNSARAIAPEANLFSVANKGGGEKLAIKQT